MKMRFWATVLCVASATGLAAQDGSLPVSPEQLEFFESRIRPVLAQDCYECHSEAEGRKGGLNLDSRPGWQAGGKSGAVIVPGHPGESLLIRAIRHEGDAPKMPKAGARLDDEVVEDFVRWIAMGAPDPRDRAPAAERIEADRSWEAIRERRKQWWSFQPIDDPRPPRSEWSGHPVDAFLDARRRERGLEAAAPAQAHVLVRRLHLVLIGLPPTPEQTRSFVQAHGEDPGRAVERRVDELLASPHFGERWARHWMDWIRYAESHGSEGDPAIGNAHLYRDYLIRALNADVPYDQLVREHVAGDLLENPRVDHDLGINESLVGTVHWRMVFHGFAPTDALDERVRFTDDMINVFSKTFMGLTVSCARCHDHKFDAISQRDYHAFFSILGSTRPGRKAIDLPERLNLHRERLAGMKPALREAIAGDWLAGLDGLSRSLAPGAEGVTEASEERPLLLPLQRVDQGEDFAAVWAALQDEWNGDREAREAHRDREFLHRWRLDLQEDRDRWFAEGPGPGAQPAPPGDFSVAAEGDRVLAGIHSGGVYTHLVSTRHGGRLTSPDFRVEGDTEVWMLLRGAGRSSSRYVVQNYPRSGTVFPIRDLRKDRWYWERYNLDYWTGDDVHLEVTTARDAPLQLRGEERSWFGIREVLVMPGRNPTPPDPARIALDPVFTLMEERRPESRRDLVEAYREAIALAVTDWKEGETSDAQAELLDACLRRDLLPNDREGLPSAAPLLARWRALETEIPVATRVPTLSEWQGQDLPLFERGDHRKPGEAVPRRFLEAIDDTPYASELSGRRQLAEDILREDNPLPRRVVVNRIWHHLFGRGLVATPDNFGRLGEPPSHPLLLDHLASRFSGDHRWSIKRLVRYLVTTRTWQLDGSPDEEARRIDPDNVHLSHFRVRRLEAEVIRDSMLALSGALDPVAPRRPVGGREPRRSVYLSVIRNRLDPFLTIFDAPVPFSSHGRRHVTTVPGQSLALMNGEFARDMASRWGRQLALQARDTDRSDLVSEVWMRAFSSLPSPEERETVREFMTAQEDRYRAHRTGLEAARVEHARLGTALADLMEVARERWSATREEDLPLLEPLAQWLFEEDAQDSVGSLHLSLEGGARLEGGALVLPGGNAFARSAPLERDLGARTLEARVRLDNLDQRGGGALSVQTRNGATFDAIVYGEKEPRRWISGSDGFQRTRDFAGAPAESEPEELHLAIAYHEDGTIAAYRNGRPYGASYRVSPPVTYRKGSSEVLLGLRHGDPGGNRMLTGRILEARLHDRALSAEEVEKAAHGLVATRSRLLSLLSDEERERYQSAQAEHVRLGERLPELERMVPENGADSVWDDLALSIFNLKEFIYVQ